jgi:5-deoxy-glucuronate isomerase
VPPPFLTAVPEVRPAWASPPLFPYAMTHHLRAHDNSNRPIVEPGQGLLARSYFNLLRLAAGQRVTADVPGCEVLCVVMSGAADISVAHAAFGRVGQRSSVWDGPADAVYCGTETPITVEGAVDGTEVAVAGGVTADRLAPFRIAPEAVCVVDVGSAETHSRRRICHILGQNGACRAGRLWVSELYADPGCWSGYPPHKHDAERPPDETAFEEIYHYRFRPASGFGAQFLYDAPSDAAGRRASRVVMTGDGDTFLVDRGYHPTVTSPGHEGYIFTILVGLHQRSIVQSFDPVHRHLLDAIPGIQAMRDAFA